jgi:hypothetical protein
MCALEQIFTIFADIPRIARMTVTLKKSVKRGNQNPYIKEEQTT